MSQGTFSDALNRLEAFKRKFVSRPKMTKFRSGHYSLAYVPRDLGVL